MQYSLLIRETGMIKKRKGDEINHFKTFLSDIGLSSKLLHPKNNQI